LFISVNLTAIIGLLLPRLPVFVCRVFIRIESTRERKIYPIYFHMFCKVNALIALSQVNKSTGQRTKKREHRANESLPSCTTTTSFAFFCSPLTNNHSSHPQPAFPGCWDSHSWNNSLWSGLLFFPVTPLSPAASCTKHKTQTLIC